MTPQDVYNSRVIETSSAIWDLDLEDVMPEIAHYDFSSIFVGENTQLERRVHAFHTSDGRRIWRLSSYCYSGVPFMVVQQAGREGDDHVKRWITDLSRFGQAILYVRGLIPVEINDQTRLDTVSFSSEVGDLAQFYGHELNIGETK